MKIILVRHGETDANSEGIIQGQALNGSLNDKGIRQAQRLSQQLKNKQIDICLTSPLARTWQTAMIIVGDRVEIKEDSRLIERYLGGFEGATRNEYDAAKKYWDYNLNSSDNEVESIQNIFKRCNLFLEDLKANYPDDSTVLIVSHSAIVRAIHHIINKTDLNTDLFSFKIDNCFYHEYNY